MTAETDNAEAADVPARISHENLKRLRIVGVLLTVVGIFVFGYFVYSVGVGDIVANVKRFGFDGFVAILAIYFVRICSRAAAWKLSVYEPYELTMRDCIPAVIIGEAMSTMIPLGILVSGTTKALAVRKKLPMVVGLSSVATENLFYSIATSFFLIAGALTLLRSFDLEEGWRFTLDLLIGVIVALVLFLFLLVIRQWHFASEACEGLYRRGYFTGLLENGRLEVRLFENIIYGFYRQFPRRFVPIFLLEIVFHSLGVCEAWLILSRLLDNGPLLMTAFILESVSRMLTIVFKLVPFLIGVDEAGAQFVAETLAIGAGIGVALAIIRKGRLLFWTAIGVILMLVRRLTRQPDEAGQAPH